MKYQNVETGFVFETKSKVSAEGWVCLDPQPTIKKPATKKKPKKEQVK